MAGGNSGDLLNLIKKLDVNDPTENWVGPYTMIKTLGKGATGVVRLAQKRDDIECEVAIKIVDLDYIHTMPDEKKRIEREITILKKLEHPYLMKLHDVIETKTHKYMILEYLRGGELYDYLLKQGGKLSNEEAFKCFFQLLVAIAFMHRNKVVHRDIKLENMIRDAYGNVKLADFGMACEVPPSGILEESVGSPHYACPEVVKGVKYNGYQADSWSMGVVLFVLLTGALPFAADNMDLMFDKIKKGDYRLPPELPNPAQDLIKSLINPTASARLDVHGVARHPWFTTKATRITGNERRLMEAEFPPDDGATESLHSKLLSPNMKKPS